MHMRFVIFFFFLSLLLFLDWTENGTAIISEREKQNLPMTKMNYLWYNLNWVYHHVWWYIDDGFRVDLQRCNALCWTHSNSNSAIKTFTLAELSVMCGWYVWGAHNQQLCSRYILLIQEMEWWNQNHTNMEWEKEQQQQKKKCDVRIWMKSDISSSSSSSNSCLANASVQSESCQIVNIALHCTQLC